MTKDRTNSKSLAIREKCRECMGNYFDGRVDCRNVKCPLYKWMPYAEKTPDFPWAAPRSTGGPGGNIQEAIRLKKERQTEQGIDPTV